MAIELGLDFLENKKDVKYQITRPSREDLDPQILNLQAHCKLLLTCNGEPRHMNLQFARLS